MKAIILAAGLGTRLRPMTENTPKALVKVNQKPLVEYQIEFLKERGIDDIIIVVGYLKEQFDYLKEKYGVRLVFNEKYADYNNFYSLYLVKEELANSYVIDADNYLFKNMFRNDIERSTYFSVYREDCDNEWFLVYGDDYKVQDIIVDSKNGRILSGVSFWDAPTAEKIVGFIVDAYASGKFVDLYWDNMVKDNIKELDVYVEELEENSIYEIDSVKVRKDSFFTKISNFYELIPYLFLLDFLCLIQYTSENLTFKGSPERLTRCQRKETTIGASKASAYLLLLCKYLN